MVQLTFYSPFIDCFRTVIVPIFTVVKCFDSCSMDFGESQNILIFLQISLTKDSIVLTEAYHQNSVTKLGIIRLLPYQSDIA